MEKLFKTLIVLMIAIPVLQGCNQTKNDKTEKSYQKGPAEKTLNKVVSLTAKPNDFKLSQLPGH